MRDYSIKHAELDCPTLNGALYWLTEVAQGGEVSGKLRDECAV
jgi:hypothetical protein